MSTLVDDILYSLNGRVTGLCTVDSLVKNKAAHAICQENDGNNAWNVNSNGNVNNWNKNNQNAVRAVAALGEEEKVGWVEAFMDCIRKKRTTKGCNDYLVGDFESDLWYLIYEVNERIYKPGTSICFMVRHPRYREVFAAMFRDRIVQHWVARRTEPLFETTYKAMGNVSYNCRKGYGTWKAVYRLQELLKENPDMFVGRFDLSNFFMSISKSLLLLFVIDKLKKDYHGEDKEQLLWLTKVIVEHRPQDDCVIRSDPKLWERLPKRKSLFGSDGFHGLAIGNITSQLFANYMVSRFDKWVDLRFVDDFIVIGTKEELKRFRREAEKWLMKCLGLRLHSDKVYIQPARRSVKFVGSVIKDGRLYTSKQSVGRFVDAVRRLDDDCKYLYHTQSVGNAQRVEKGVSVVNSYLGMMSHTQSYAIRRKWLGRTIYLWKCCSVAGHFEKVEIKRQYKTNNILLIKERQKYGVQKHERKAGADRHTRKGVRTAQAVVRRQSDGKHGRNVEL